MNNDQPRNTVTNDAVSDLTGTTTAAWIDDNPVGRCTSSHRLAGADGEINVRCDGQAGHGGARHQALVDGIVVRWRDELAGERDEPTGGAPP